MKKIFLLFIFFFTTGFPQAVKQNEINLFSPANIKKFADYLFCSNDYLRAALEYEKYFSLYPNDSVKFKIATAYSKIGDYDKSALMFDSFTKSSELFPYAKMEYFKSLFQEKNYFRLRSSILNIDSINNFRFAYQAKELYYYSYLFTIDTLPPESIYLAHFDKTDIRQIKNFYEWKTDPPHKSPLLAALLSAVIPGAGKFYVDQVADGITALVATASLGYLSYTDFKAGHYFRGWLFGGLAAGFYAGNIYGSAAAAQIYNVKIQFDFENSIGVFINAKNFFTPGINFCK